MYVKSFETSFPTEINPCIVVRVGCSSRQQHRPFFTFHKFAAVTFNSTQFNLVQSRDELFG